MPIEFITVAAVAMPFIVEQIKKWLPHYDPRFLAGIVSTVLAIGYTAFVSFAPEQFLAIAASTFALGTAVYKAQKPTNP